MRGGQSVRYGHSGNVTTRTWVVCVLPPSCLQASRKSPSMLNPLLPLLCLGMGDVWGVHVLLLGSSAPSFSPSPASLASTCLSLLFLPPFPQHVHPLKAHSPHPSSAFWLMSPEVSPPHSSGMRVTVFPAPLLPAGSGGGGISCTFYSGMGRRGHVSKAVALESSRTHDEGLAHILTFRQIF